MGESVSGSARGQILGHAPEMIIGVPLRVPLSPTAEERKQEMTQVARSEVGLEDDPRLRPHGLEPILVPGVGTGVARFDRVSIRWTEDDMFVEGHGGRPRRAVEEPDLVAVPLEDLPRARRGRRSSRMVIGAKVRPPCVDRVPREGDDALEADDHLMEAAGEEAEAVPRTRLGPWPSAPP